jgi:hypothetical protein
MNVDHSSRRAFLQGMLGVGACCCLGGQGLRAAVQAAGTHPFETGARMTFRQVFDFCYARAYIPLLKEMRTAMGEDKFMPLLRESAARSAEAAMRKLAGSVATNDLAQFTSSVRNPDHFWRHVLKMEIKEDAAEVVEVRIRQCLWVETFRGADAADIGYAVICHPDFAAARGFNPRLRLHRSRTLMEGDPCCDHRWVVMS